MLFPRMLFTRIVLPGLLLAAPLQAATVEGVTLDDSISVADTMLTRNGTGIRKHFFIMNPASAPTCHAMAMN